MVSLGIPLGAFRGVPEGTPVSALGLRKVSEGYVKDLWLPWGVQALSWDNILVMLGLSWGYPGDILGVAWGHLGPLIYVCCFSCVVCFLFICGAVFGAGNRWSQKTKYLQKTNPHL